MSATEPTAQPTTQPPAQPTVPPASPQADAESIGWEDRPVREPRRLVRCTEDRMIGGVCSGLARHLGLDPTLVRVLAILAAVFGAGSAVIAYLIAWVIIPAEAPQGAAVDGVPVVAPR